MVSKAWSGKIRDLIGKQKQPSVWARVDQFLPHTRVVLYHTSLICDSKQPLGVSVGEGCVLRGGWTTRVLLPPA